MTDFQLTITCVILGLLIAGLFLLAWIGDRVIPNIDEHEDINRSI